MFTQKYLVTLVIFLDLLTHMQKGEPGPSLAEVSPGGGGGVVEEEEDKVSCDWWRAGHVTTVLISDWPAGGPASRHPPAAAPRQEQTKAA